MEKKAKQIDQAKVKEKLTKLGPQLAELQQRLAETTDKGKQRKLVEKIGYTQGEIEQAGAGQRISRQEKRDLIAYSFIVPNLIGFVVSTLVPIIFAFMLAFAKWDENNAMEFVGLSNLFRAFTNDRFIVSLKNTILYCTRTVLLALAAALGLAIILNQKVKGRNFFRAANFSPHVASLATVAMVWNMLFSSQKSGPVNMLSYNLGVTANHLPRWSTDKDWVMFTIVSFGVWKNMGCYMVTYLAESQGINAELYEAASLDGANTRQRFHYTT